VKERSSSFTCGWPSDLPDHARYQSVQIQFDAVTTLPPWESVLVDDLIVPPEQLSIHQDLSNYWRITTHADDADWSAVTRIRSRAT